MLLLLSSAAVAVARGPAGFPVLSSQFSVAAGSQLLLVLASSTYRAPRQAPVSYRLRMRIGDAYVDCTQPALGLGEPRWKPCFAFASSSLPPRAPTDRAPPCMPECRAGPIGMYVWHGAAAPETELDGRRVRLPASRERDVLYVRTKAPRVDHRRVKKRLSSQRTIACSHPRCTHRAHIRAKLRGTHAHPRWPSSNVLIDGPPKLVCSCSHRPRDTRAGKYPRSGRMRSPLARPPPPLETRTSARRLFCSPRHARGWRRVGGGGGMSREVCPSTPWPIRDARTVRACWSTTPDACTYAFTRLQHPPRTTPVGSSVLLPGSSNRPREGGHLSTLAARGVSAASRTLQPPRPSSSFQGLFTPLPGLFPARRV
ncbi:hypothetical protein C8Q77DRAFT_433666 [Trametes polyzona]|nr:hypothetical protein C8Q77DRAFT_433666 [Trametes polyzona]